MTGRLVAIERWEERDDGTYRVLVTQFPSAMWLTRPTTEEYVCYGPPPHASSSDTGVQRGAGGSDE